VYLKRESMNPSALTLAILRSDGVHFIDRDGRERAHAEYPSLEEMNRVLRELGFGQFEVDKEAGL
jgi:hypothetical protein